MSASLGHGKQKKSMKVPEHIAIIMDGNGRWALNKNKPRIFGHRFGLRTVRMVIEESIKLKVKHLTLFAFSSENWNRPADEIKWLMKLFVRSIVLEKKKLIESNIKLNILGDISKFSSVLQNQMLLAIEDTMHCDGLHLNIAAGYGGRWDIVHISKQLIQDVLSAEVRYDEIDEALFQRYMLRYSVPDIDLLIRTGKEQRISNFFLWQLAYSEYFFSQVLWPDFSILDFKNIIYEYQLRQRRFGNISVDR